jgi:hypothetical protein
MVYMILGLYVVTDSESRFRRSLCNFIYTWLPRLRSRRRFDALNSETSMHREISADRWDARDTLIEKRTSSTRRRSVPFGLSLPSDPFTPITMFPSLTLSPCNRALTYPHMFPQPEVEGTTLNFRLRVVSLSSSFGRESALTLLVCLHCRRMPVYWA